MAEDELLALGREAERMIHDLAGISAEEGRLVRLYLTPEHRRAADLVGRWMAEAGSMSAKIRWERSRGGCSRRRRTEMARGGS